MPKIWELRKHRACITSHMRGHELQNFVPISFCKRRWEQGYESNTMLPQWINKVFQLWWVYDFSKNEMERLVENMLHLPVGVTVVQVWLPGGWVKCWSTAFIVAVSSGDTPSTPSSVSAPRVPRESSAKTEILVSEPVMFIQPLDLTQQGLDIIQDCQWNFLLTF